MKPLPPLAFLALLTAAAWAATEAGAPRVYVNGLPLRHQAIVKGGVTYVPLRAVAESLGCTVDYNPKAGVFIWGGQQSPQPPGLPSDSDSAPSPFAPDPRPKVPEPPSPGR